MVAIVVGCIGNNGLGIVSVVQAAEAREGYYVTPVKTDATGVLVDSGFSFHWQKEGKSVTKEQLTKGFRMEQVVYDQAKATANQPVAVEITAAEQGFLIQPTAKLAYNSLYILSYQGITWVYKTETDFNLVGLFPRNQATNVPVNSGIELYFNYGPTELKDYFTIEPQVDGKFEWHDQAAVFVPKQLQPKTVYTVTVKKGLPLTGSTKKLAQEVVFQFETEEKATAEMEEFHYLNFNHVLNECRPNEVPQLLWNYYSSDNQTLAAKIKVYSYPKAADFTADIIQYSQIPSWSYYNQENHLADTKRLNQVMSFDKELISTANDPKALELPSGLNRGYYVVDVEIEKQHYQTFVQVTELSYLYQADAKGSLFWVNNLTTKTAEKDVQITADTTGKTVTTDADGVARLEKEKEDVDYHIYQLKKGNMEAVHISLKQLRHYGWYDKNNDYWSYFKSDRGLYRPDDTVQFFGFLQNRYQAQDIDKLTVEIGKGGYDYFYRFFPMPIDRLSLVDAEVAVKDGYYEGQLELPNLAPGGYQVQVKLADQVISSTYITVEEFVKPSYKIELTKDKEAVFAGQPVEYLVKTMFFEGTPVSYLDYDYVIDDYNHSSKQSKTDAKGQDRFSYTPTYQKPLQGEGSVYVTARAKLPESGQISANDLLRVFYNNIHVDIQTTVNQGKGRVEAKLHHITLERLNNGTAKDRSDYLDKPVTNHTVQGKIYRNEWKRRAVGKYYDYINKENRTSYEYYLDRTFYKDIRLTTDAKGQATAEVDLKQEKSVYYTAEFTTLDTNQRSIKQNNYFGRDWEWEYSYRQGDYYHVEADQEQYTIGQPVKLSVKNNDQLLGKGSYLYSFNQNGIKQVVVSKSPQLEQAFQADYVPNVYAMATYFNGKAYITADPVNLSFDYQTKDIQVETKLSKPSYRPGEQVVVDFTATTMSDGKRVPVQNGIINLGLVDEALFALQEEQVDVLKDLYQSVGNGVKAYYISHSYYDNPLYTYSHRGRGDSMDKMEMAVTEEAADTSNMASEKPMMKGESDQAGGQVRTEFKDTALFQTVRLDETGKGRLRFQLPDNITSWRLTGVALAEDLRAGTKIENIIVSKPFFINTSLANVYLIGDQPSIGVTAYGSQLVADQSIAVTVELYRKGSAKPIHTETAKTKAFERVNLALGRLTEVGDYQVRVTATNTASTEQVDRLQYEFKVVDSFHQQMISDYYAAKVGLKIKAPSSGDITLTFADQGMGKYLPELTNLAYSGGKRVDQKYLASLAIQLLNQKFGLQLPEMEVKLSDYVREDGGISILPTAESDLTTTVSMLPLIQSQISRELMVVYLKNAYYNQAIADKGAALYGLSLLGEDVYDWLTTYVKAKNLTAKDRLYLALTYLNIGDRFTAESIYNQVITDKLIEKETTAYIKLTDKEHQNLELTALGMLINQQLDKAVSAKMFDYVVRTDSSEILCSSYLYQYVLAHIEKYEAEKGQIKAMVSYEYNGKAKSVEFGNFWADSITIPAKTINRFKITKLSGDVSVVATYSGKLADAVTNDKNLEVTRTYYNYLTGKPVKQLKQGDIVKVVLDWKINKAAIDDYYQLSDYAPAGLKPIDSQWEFGITNSADYYWFRDVENQKVTFYIGKNYSEYRPLVYYARIVSVGQYQWEAPIIQGTRNKDSRYLGSTQRIEIQ